MSLCLSFFFILSFNVIIFNLPSSRGYNTGYHVSTISQVLTLGERLTYILFGTLPSRIYYSYSKRCYVVRGQAGLYKNDLKRKKRKNGKGYKAIPRWKYYLSKLSPVGIFKTLKDMSSLSKALLGFGGKDYGDLDSFDSDVDLENPDYDSESDKDGGPKDGDPKDGGPKDGKKNEEGSGMFPTDFISTLSNYLMGGSNDENKDNKNDDNSDKKDDKKDDDSTGLTQMAKDVLGSDIAKDVAKDVVKTGIECFVPGGPAIVSAINKYEDSQKKAEAVEDVIDKVPKIK